MIIFDTETTNLTAPEAAPIDQQPYMIEFAGIDVHPRTLTVRRRLQFLIKPRVILTNETIAITGINNEMVRNERPFAGRYLELCDFFGGQKACCAHNLSFDVTILANELRRIGKLTAFPWPPMQICTVEKSFHIKGHRLNLTALLKELTGEDRKDAHRAMPDCETLLVCVIAMRNRGLL